MVEAKAAVGILLDERNAPAALGARDVLDERSVQMFARDGRGQQAALLRLRQQLVGGARMVLPRTSPSPPSNASRSGCASERVACLPKRCGPICATASAKTS
ncbi:MAG: hypothetical protein ACREQ5_24705, partial [Candidatus Dormibacteria bacterium]